MEKKKYVNIFAVNIEELSRRGYEEIPRNL
jgi:hypothetical protein